MRGIEQPATRKAEKPDANWQNGVLPCCPDCHAAFFVDQPLIAGTELSLPDAVVRHVQVLRLNAGDALTVFNGSPPIWSTRPGFWPSASAKYGYNWMPHWLSRVSRRCGWGWRRGISSGERMDFTLQKGGNGRQRVPATGHPAQHRAAQR